MLEALPARKSPVWPNLKAIRVFGPAPINPAIDSPKFFTGRADAERRVACDPPCCAWTDDSRTAIQYFADDRSDDARGLRAGERDWSVVGCSILPKNWDPRLPEGGPLYITTGQLVVPRDHTRSSEGAGDA